MRQGSVLSPSLFNVYLDSLLDRLKDCGFGQELTLSGCILLLKSVVKHLGIVMDTFCLTSVSVEARVRKFFGGVNSVLG